MFITVFTTAHHLTISQASRLSPQPNTLFLYDPFYYYYYLHLLLLLLLILCTYFIFSPVNVTLIYLGIIINFSPYIDCHILYFVLLIIFWVFLCTRANFVIGLCAVKFASK
jgi:hypothetical protein